jgi:hypothetical protein
MAPESHNPKKTGHQAGKKQAADSKKSGVSKKSNSSETSGNFWISLDRFFLKYSGFFLFLSVSFSVLFGILLFDARISTGGDDSHYIEMANDFLKGRSFPSWHGPLYSIFLSVPILLFGVNIIWLKATSFIFIIAQLILFYYTFKDHVSPTIFTMVLLIISVSSSILYFASQTYSEAMFMFLQALTLFIFIRTYLNSRLINPSWKQDAVQWLIVGFFVFLTSLTRDIGLAMLLAIIIFLLLEKKFRAALFVTLSYTLFFSFFKIYKSLLWSHSSAPDKLAEILAKNQYNAAMGSENFAGMVNRFLLNAKGYLSRHFMIGLGLQDPASTEKSYVIAILVAVLLLIALIYSFRRNKVLFFCALYIGGALASTFIVLNQVWDQMRMVIIFIPMMILLSAWGVQQLSQRKGFQYFNILLHFLLILIFFKTLDHTLDQSKDNRKVLKKSLSGNLYYGFSPDWQNFLRMSEWVSKNIPKDQLVASRKPSMSYIYGKGRDFYPLYRFPTKPPEEFIRAIEKRTGTLTVIPNTAINPAWPAELQYSIKRSNVACVAEGNVVYGVYEFTPPASAYIVKALATFNVRTITTDSLIKRIRVSTMNCFAVSPDSLVNTLKKNKVTYAIVASLRANPRMNTANVINTLQRYLYFVEQKYPGIIKLVHQIGANNEEPAWLYQIDYSIYGI